MGKKVSKTIPSILLVVTGVISFWRGAWGLMDTYLLPEHPEMSYILSIAIGLGILLFTRRITDSL